MVCHCEGVDEDAFWLVSKAFYVAFLFFFSYCLFLQITKQIYVGSCIQTEADVETLSDAVGALIHFI